MRKEWLQVEIGKDLKRELKAKTARDGISMVAAVEAFVRLYTAGQLDDVMSNAMQLANEKQPVTAA